MNEGYRRIYYDKETGNVLAIVAFNGSFIPETVEQDISKLKVLFERNRDTFDVIELPFEAYAQDFAECNGYRVNIETKELEFSYPDPNEPDVEQPYQPSLSAEVERLKQEDLNNKEAIAELYILSMGGF